MRCPQFLLAIVFKERDRLFECIAFVGHSTNFRLTSKRCVWIDLATNRIRPMLQCFN